MTIRQTTEQERARLAWEDIEEVKDEKTQKKYGTLARKLPAMIQMNGLGTTLAFLYAKGKGDRKDGHTIISDHLSKRVLHYLKTDNYETLLHLVRDADTATYRRATAEAIEYGIWLKRYVEAKDWGSAEEDND